MSARTIPTASSSRAKAARWSSASGDDENFVASDVAALLPVTRRFMFLEEGDVAEIRRTVDRRSSTRTATPRERPVRESELSADAAEKGQYRALHAQGDPRAAARGRADAGRARRRRQAARGRVRPRRDRSLRAHRGRAHRRLRHQLPRRRRSRVLHRADLHACPARSRSRANTAIAIRWCRRTRCSSRISQSGETADTLAALRLAKQAGYLSQLAICNVPESSLVRESELVMLTRAGPGDRRRLDQGLHHAARGARHAGRSRSPSIARRRRRARARPRAAADRDSGADREDAGARSGHLRARASASPTSSTRCSSAAARCTRSRWKAR